MSKKHFYTTSLHCGSGLNIRNMHSWPCTFPGQFWRTWVTLKIWTGKSGLYFFKSDSEGGNGIFRDTWSVLVCLWDVNWLFPPWTVVFMMSLFFVNCFFYLILPPSIHFSLGHSQTTREHGVKIIVSFQLLSAALESAMHSLIMQQTEMSKY